VRVLFGCNKQGDLRFIVNELSYSYNPKSLYNKGAGEVTVYEQEKPHRPTQAVLELFGCLKQKGFLTPELSRELTTFFIQNHLVSVQDLEQDDIFGKFFKGLVKGLYGVDLNAK
jgi:hypothetical protein